MDILFLLIPLAVVLAFLIGAAFVWTPASYVLYVVVAALWLVPDRRIERIAVEAPGAPVGPE